jgi:hypothetical protein
MGLACVCEIGGLGWEGLEWELCVVGSIFVSFSSYEQSRLHI